MLGLFLTSTRRPQFFIWYGDSFEFDTPVSWCLATCCGSPSKNGLDVWPSNQTTCTGNCLLASVVDTFTQLFFFKGLFICLVEGTVMLNCQNVKNPIIWKSLKYQKCCAIAVTPAQLLLSILNEWKLVIVVYLLLLKSRRALHHLLQGARGSMW